MSDMSIDDLPSIDALIIRCQAGSDGDCWDIIMEAARLAWIHKPERYSTVARLADVRAYLDAAVALLPDGAVWRAYTDDCATTYGASPYNAGMQERFDGFSQCRPLAITAAFLEMQAAPLRKALAAHSRKVARHV